MTKQELQTAIRTLEASETVTNGKTNYSEIERKINALVDAYCAQFAKKANTDSEDITNSLVAVGY